MFRFQGIGHKSETANEYHYMMNMQPFIKHLPLINKKVAGESCWWFGIYYLPNNLPSTRYKMYNRIRDS